MVYILLLFLFVCCGQAADNVWGDADMQVVYRSGLARSWSAGLKGEDIPLADITLRNSAFNQIVRGYCFAPKIEEIDRSYPDLRKNGVRQFICERKPFLSQELEQCLEKVVDVLEEDKDIPVPKPIFWNQLTGDLAKERLLPAGKTHKWSVVEAQSVKGMSTADRVYFVFRGESEALMGVPCSKKTSIPLERSLLHFTESVQPETTSVESIPTPEELLKSYCGSRYNLGIVYFQKKNARSAALVNASSLTSTVTYKWGGDSVQKEKQDTFEAIKLEILRGVYPTRKTSAKKDMAVLKEPRVLKYIDQKGDFTSAFLDNFLLSVGPFLQKKENTLCEPHPFWRGLTEEQCANICPAHKKIEWTFITKEDLLRQLDSARQGTVLLILQGGIALKGLPVPLHRDVNWVKDNLFAEVAKHCAVPTKGEPKMLIAEKKEA